MDCWWIEVFKYAMYLDFPNNETIAPSDYIPTHTMRRKKIKWMGDSPLLAILLQLTLQSRRIYVDQGGKSCRGLLEQLIGKPFWAKHLCSPFLFFAITMTSRLSSCRMSLVPNTTDSMAWVLSTTVIFGSICAKFVVISEGTKLCCSTKLLTIDCKLCVLSEKSSFHDWPNLIMNTSKCNTRLLCDSTLNLLNLSLH